MTMPPLRINAGRPTANDALNAASTYRRGPAAGPQGTANEFAVSYYHLHYNDKPGLGFQWLDKVLRRPRPPTTNTGTAHDFQNDKADVLDAVAHPPLELTAAT
jgi:hypothetical protein